MKKFFIITLIVSSLFSLHIIEETLRVGISDFDPSAFIPLIMYPIALIAMYTERRGGVLLATMLHIIGAVLTSVGHFNPASEDFVLLSLVHWGGLTGLLAVLLGASTSILSIVASFVGIQTIRHRI